MTEKLSPRITAALADLQSAIDAEAVPGVVPNLMVLIDIAPGRGRAYYSGCTCMQCTLANIRMASRIMQDCRDAEDRPGVNALAVAAAGQVH